MATGAMSSLSAHYQRMGKGWFNSKALCLHQPLMFGRLKQQLFHFSVMKVFAPMYTMFIRVLQDGALDLYWKNTHIPFVQNTNGNHINQENCCCQEKKSVGNFVNHCLSNIFLRDEVVGGTNIWCWWPWFGCVHVKIILGLLGNWVCWVCWNLSSLCWDSRSCSVTLTTSLKMDRSVSYSGGVSVRVLSRLWFLPRVRIETKNEIVIVCVIF